MLEIRIDRAQLERITQALNPRELQRAVRNATDTAATAIKKIAIEEVTNIYRITSKRVSTTEETNEPTITTIRTTQTKPYAILRFSRNKFRLDNFTLNTLPWTKVPRIKGWVPLWRYKRVGAISTVPKGFVGEGKLAPPYGTIWRRSSKGSTKIRKCFGLSLNEMMKDKNILAGVKRQGVGILISKLQEQTRKQIAKRKG